MSTPNDKVVCEEIYGSSGKKNVFVETKERKDDKTVGISKSVERLSIRSSISDVFKSAFLPQGYPDSVSEDYLRYQIWDSIQAFVSRLMGTLSTREVLKGIGVGDESVTILAATITWLLRDGTSMLARILFAWYESSGLDYNSKQWRLFADVMNDIAIFFDLLASHFRMLSMPILCLAGVFRATVDAAGGATRAAFVQHQARRGNLADVAAKDGSQETLVNLAGLLTSLLVLPLVETDAAITWMLFVLLMSLHLFANYKAVKSVSLKSLNQLRLSILVKCFWEENPRMPTVEEVNLAEPVIPGKTHGPIHLGCSFEKALAAMEASEVICHRTSRYLLVLKFNTHEVFVVLERGCDVLTEIESSFQAHVMLYNLRMIEQRVSPDPLGFRNKKGVEMRIKAYMDKNFPAFLKMLTDNGWETGRTLLGSDEWRITWKKEKDN